MIHCRSLEEATCRFCDNGEESTFHIFAECEYFAAMRFETTGHPFLEVPFQLRAKTKHKIILAFLRNAELPSLNELLTD